MDTSALIMMVLSNGIITGFTFYFFVKMLKTPLKTPENDELNYP